MAASGGASYLWKGTRFSADFLFGTGLRTDETLPDGSTIPNGGHVPSYTQINLGLSHAFHLAGSSTLTARFDVINVTDKTYEIRDGSGIGVFASAVRSAPRVLWRTGVGLLGLLRLPATPADRSAVASEGLTGRLAVTRINAAMLRPVRGFFAGVSKTF